MRAMRYNTLGQTGLLVSELCLGTLDAASAMPRDYPGWMIERQSGLRPKQEPRRPS